MSVTEVVQFIIWMTIIKTGLVFLLYLIWKPKKMFLE